VTNFAAIENGLLSQWRLARWRLLSRWGGLRALPLRLLVRYLSSERPWHSPRSVQIEATSKCNLRCPTCSHKADEGSGQHLTGERLRKIIDRLPSSPARVRLSGIGEPLLNPHFFSLVDILAERGIKCDFITNGTLLLPRMREGVLSRANIDEVIVSCDGARKSTFESCRVGADFDSWKQLVADFLAEAKRRRRQTLRVSASTVVSKQNLNELGDIIRLAADLSINRVTLLSPIPVDDVAVSLCPSPTEMSSVHLEELERMAAVLGVRICCALGPRSSLPPASIPQCMQPWEYVFIRANGAIQPCSALFGSDKVAVMGNMLEQDFTEIWRGARFREFRRTSALGTNSLCRLCPYY
jgi:radical SAM protein with 4Fe4S-binding SPASM domain